MSLLLVVVLALSGFSALMAWGAHTMLKEALEAIRVVERESAATREQLDRIEGWSRSAGTAADMYQAGR